MQMAAKCAGLCSLLLLLTLAGAVAGEGHARNATKCSEEDLKIRQWQVTRGRHPRWKMEVSTSCETCEASLVEVRCPGWVEGKPIEGYMYPVELVEPDLCMLGAPITASQPFSTVYHQPAGQIQLSIASARFNCTA
ncbi:hypothetical protein GOP47_0005360 [Adiantum capillus-veneris]|uniref:Uncharacterized protein n=1 Tax=Adiantum capillus-veneris TaxID=13818 RepID=A0A9D4V5V6_ADICA|nr:hypothetical protein GOP47_0005360 [Adiantum capillus-veneris]